MDFVDKFREAVKFPTWWPPEAQGGDTKAEAPILHFQDFLLEQFPVFHEMAQRWVLSPYSVVYRLPRNNHTDEPVLLLAHYDVVPAETEKWKYNPFGAETIDGFIYGRGTLDMKSILISIMEAAENLCKIGWKPKRDIWFAFGGDEERAGILGAMETVRWFEKKEQRFAWILDEGTPIAENHIKGINSPLALVSIEEKGYLSLNLTVAQEPGHASRPPKIQAAAVLGRALCRIAKKPFPFKLGPTVEAFFKQIAPLMPGIQGFVMRYARAFGTVFFKLAAGNPSTESMLRTTVAMTQLEGSAADNVLPSLARAVINLRLLYPWTAETAIDYIKKIINDERVQLSVYGLGTDPVAASNNYKSQGWSEIQTALEQAWPGVPMLPFMMVATTDSRHYQKITNGIFRFSPYKLDPKELGGIHGHDERISEENLRKGLIFYTKLLESI